MSPENREAHIGESVTLANPSPFAACFCREFMNSHYMVVASEFTNTSGELSYAADTLVYKWLGEHFDIIQRLPTSGARAVTAFTIDSNQYLVVVNHVNDLGESPSTVFGIERSDSLFAALSAQVKPTFNRPCTASTS